MKKHLKMHEEETTMCKFFAKREHCPYEEIHCQFNHEHDEELETVSDDDNGDSYEFVENECHLCKLQLHIRDELYYLVETQHVEYHQGVLEILVNRRNIT
jgi:hypothetical protein